MADGSQIRYIKNAIKVSAADCSISLKCGKWVH